MVIVGSCTNSYGEFDLSESPVGFLKGLNQVNISFPTDDPNQDVRFKFKKKQGAIRPSLSEALRFVSMNGGYDKTYIRDKYDCKQFAYQLFLDAQKENYEAQFVILRLKNEEEGHALTVIHTLDAGPLYVDFTPFLTNDDLQKPAQTIALVKEGHPYIRIPLQALERNFSNSNMDFEMYRAKMEKGEREVKNYNNLVTSLEEQKRAVQQKIGNFNSKVKNSQIVRANFENIKNEQGSLEREVNEINARYDHLNFEEARIRNMYYFSNWIGKAWVVESVKQVP